MTFSFLLFSAISAANQAGPPKTPIGFRRSFCCARAAIGDTSAAPPGSVMNSRRTNACSLRRSPSAPQLHLGNRPASKVVTTIQRFMALGTTPIAFLGAFLG
jgi:hypothetical protein